MPGWTNDCVVGVGVPTVRSEQSVWFALSGVSCSPASLAGVQPLADAESQVDQGAGSSQLDQTGARFVFGCLAVRLPLV